MRTARLGLAGMLLLAPGAWMADAQRPPGGRQAVWAHVEAWVSAVETHEPGMTDAAIQAMLAVSANDLEACLPYLVAALEEALPRDVEVPFDDVFRRYAGRRLSAAERDVLAGLGRRIERRGTTRFVKRAAMLHADLAIVAPRAHRSSRAGTGSLARDGRSSGDAPRPWHWMLGRAFLELVPAAGADAQVRIWYQAVANHLLGLHDFTEARPHLARALEIFPRDAEVQFLRGFLHEALGAPPVQAAIAERLAQIAPSERSRIALNVRAARAERLAALEAFTSAVARNPGHVEARIRLGRALTLEGHADRAAAELRTALDGLEDRRQAYLARLFLGRAEELRGRREDARAAYETAAALFPHAQSPRLALSVLALQAGERGAAVALSAFLERQAGGDDPWWSYYSERAPDRHEWIERLWAAFREEAVP